jgi:hypothetical protein
MVPPQGTRFRRGEAWIGPVEDKPRGGPAGRPPRHWFSSCLPVAVAVQFGPLEVGPALG